MKIEDKEVPLLYLLVSKNKKSPIAIKINSNKSMISIINRYKSYLMTLY